MDANEKISQLENEIKVLKNEVQAVLIDLRENYLTAENPFNATSAPVTSQQIILDRQVPAAEQRPYREPERSAAYEDKRESEQEDRAPGDDEAESERPAAHKRNRKIDKEDTEVSGHDEIEEEKPSVRNKNRKIEPVEPENTTASDNNEIEPERPVALKTSRRSELQTVVSGNNEAQPQIAQEEVVGARQTIPDFYPAGLSGTHATGRKMDIITIAGLAHWAEESTGRLGRERTEAILTIAEKMGYLPPEIKLVLSNLINIKPNGNGEKITVRHYLDALVKVTTLLGKGNESEAALLSILFQEDDHR